MANKQISNELWSHAYEIDDKVDVVLSAIQKSIKTATVDTIIKDHIYLYKNTPPPNSV